MKSSAQDKVEGGLKQAAGKIKEETGQALGNPRMEGEGAAKKLEGQAQRKVGDVKKVFNK
jgi:uncharacterized protein YjbJ (UPF0337 family)